MNAVPHLNVKVNDDEIVVTQTALTSWRSTPLADYEPELISKGKLYGPRQFLTRAWLAANEKARELGWIV